MNATKTFYFILICLTLLGILSCSDDDVVVPKDYSSIVTISYSQDVHPIFIRSCVASGCHNSNSNAAGLSLVSWEALMKGSVYGNVLVAYKPEKSLITTLFDGTPLRKQHPDLTLQGITATEVSFLKRWISEGAKNDGGDVPFQHSVHKAYVPNQGEDNVAIIDLDSMVVSRYISVGRSAAIEGPHFVVADSDFWYVSLISAGEVWKFDAHADTLVKRGTVPGAPALLALSLDGSKLYVSQFMTSSTNKISVLNTATMTLIKSINVWTMPHGIRMSHDGTKVYVSNMMSDNISVIDVATDSVIQTIPLAVDANPFGPTKYAPMEIAVSPDDQKIIVTCSEQHEVRMFHAQTYEFLDSIQVGEQPWHLQFTPNGNYCYVTNREGNSVSMVHVPMRHVMGTITASSPRYFDFPHGCDITPDGKYILVSNENISPGYTPRYAQDNIGNVCIIDATLNQVVKVLEVGKMPTGLCIQQ